MLILFSDDVSAAGARLKGQDLSAKEAQKKGEVWAKEAGATLDRTVSDSIGCAAWR